MIITPKIIAFRKQDTERAKLGELLRSDTLKTALDAAVEAFSPKSAPGEDLSKLPDGEAMRRFHASAAVNDFVMLLERMTFPMDAHISEQQEIPFAHSLPKNLQQMPTELQGMAAKFAAQFPQNHIQ